MYACTPWQTGCFEDLDFSLGRRQTVVMQHYVTAGYETPVPAELGPNGVYFSTTGQIVLIQPISQFVKEAVSYIQHIAALPIDAEDDLIVDRLMARKQAGMNVQPLTRRV